MKVKCKLNNLTQFSDGPVLDRLKKFIFMGDDDLDLELNKEYVVYGVVFRDNSPWYYICTEDYDEYPKPFAADFFEVLDERLSSHWVLCTRNVNEDSVHSILVIKEWADDPCFFEKLLDGEEYEVNLFQEYRQLMDAEMR